MATATKKLKAPFPYFGGKSKVAPMVWERLGEVDNYAEPFAGSIAMLLLRPQPGKIETVNDANHYIVNFWRAVSSDPTAVARYADWPVTEADLHARHNWLVNSREAAEFRGAMVSDPEYYDAKFAGWWVWGQCCWIGGGWCESHGATADGGRKQELPCPIKKGVHKSHSKQIPNLAGDSGAFGCGVTASAGHNKRPITVLGNSNYLPGVHGKVPRLDSRGTGAGVNGKISEGRPQLGDVYDIGRGALGNKHAGTCEERRQWLTAWMQRLADRLRLVRKCYGHWSRICDSNTTMTRLGTTGVFLDPPYAKNLDRLAAWKLHLEGKCDPPAAAKGTNRTGGLYAGDESQDIDKLVAEVNAWCIKWGSEPAVRIALCGYEGEHDNLEQLCWEVVAWKSQGGYANRNSENQNKHRERIWFSPACRSSGGQQELF